MQNKVRDSRFETIRLAGMFFFVLTHATAFGIRNQILPLEPEQITASVLLNYLMNYPGTIFNVAFFIITGYFCIDKAPSPKRLALLAFREIFYVWSIGIIFCAAGKAKITGAFLAETIFPLFTGQNWFINCYLVFSLFIPYVNKGISALSGGEHKRLILILMLLRFTSAVFEANLYVTVGRDLEFFLLLYLVGAYIRRYPDPSPDSSRRCRTCLLHTGIIMLVFSASVVLMGILYRKTGISFFMDHITVLLEPAKILAGIFLFKAVTMMPPFYNRRINTLAAAVPSVYLIHENKLIRPVIWKKLFPTLPFLNTPMFPIVMLCKTAAVFIICILLDLPWRFMVRPAAERIIDRISHKTGNPAIN